MHPLQGGTIVIQGFRDFITRGNVIDLAVAFVAGAAFTGLVGSVSSSVVEPFIGLVLGGGIEAGTIVVNGQVFDFTALVNAIITFLITMAVLYFVFVLPMNAWRKRQEAEDAKDDDEATQTDLLIEIRDLLREQR
ncbi:MAG: large conductance mechanosensitive channel protein MscL [Candidatus Nanopelagicales bacterium]